MKRCVACTGGICGKCVLAIKADALSHPCWQLVLGDTPCLTPKTTSMSVKGPCGTVTLPELVVLPLVLAEEEDKWKPPHEGEHLSRARTSVIQCLMYCADLKRINEGQLFIVANEVAFS